MRANPTVKLNGDHCECPGCGELFNSTHAFDKHRIGSFAGGKRRCLDPIEMQAMGMSKNTSGWWISKERTK